MTRRIIWVLMGMVLVANLPAMASTFAYIDQQKMVAQSEAVVQGRVLSVESFWNQEGTIIVTEALVEVEEVVNGEAPTVVRVRTFGGQVDDYVIEAHGFPTFEENERVLLFLRPEVRDESIRVTGYQLGHYRIKVDADGVEMAVPTVDAEVRLIEPNGKRVSPPEALPLAVLKSEIREQARSLRPATK